MANSRGTIIGKISSRLSSLLTGETRGTRQEIIIQDLTRFKEYYEHFIEYVQNDESYVEPSMGISVKEAKDYLQRTQYSHSSVREQQNAENILEYVKQQLVTDVISDIAYGTSNYRTKSRRNISEVLRQDYNNCMQIFNKYRGTQYQLNNGNPIISYIDFENAYKRAVDLIYGTQHSADYRINKANDIAAGIPRK